MYDLSIRNFIIALLILIALGACIAWLISFSIRSALAHRDRQSGNPSPRKSEATMYGLLFGIIFSTAAICVVSISAYHQHEAQLEVDRAKQFNDSIDQLMQSRKESDAETQKSISEIKRIGNSLHDGGNDDTQQSR
jgi:hypothetical protein